MNTSTKYSFHIYTIIPFSLFTPVLSHANTGVDSTFNFIDWLCSILGPLTFISVCAIYFIFLLIARYFWIILPNNYRLLFYVQEIRSQLVIEQDLPGQESIKENKIIPEIETILSEIGPILNKKFTWRHWLFSGTGKQLACWRHAHRARIFAINLLSDSEIMALAFITSKQLAQLEPPAAKELSTRLDEVSKLKPDTTNSAASILNMITSLTKHGQEFLLDYRDNYFEDLANWQNRATWLVMASLLLLIVLGLNSNHDTLFILGAVGGLLSRMRTALVNKKFAFDYGASWSTMFLSPVVGALTGWSGTLLLFILVDVEALGPMFANFLNITDISGMEWDDFAISTVAMGLALAFGYSATFFEQIMENFNTKTNNGSTTTKTS